MMKSGVAYLKRRLRLFLLGLAAVCLSFYGMSKCLQHQSSEGKALGQSEAATRYTRTAVRYVDQHHPNERDENKNGNLNQKDILNNAYSELVGAARLKEILKGVQRLAIKDPEDALEWVIKMAPDQTQRKAISIVFNEWGKINPENAANWIMDNLSLPSPLRNVAASALATTWISLHPNNAIDWADRYFTATEDYSPFQDAIIKWASEDTQAVAEHISNTAYDDATSYIAFIDFLNVYAQKDLNGATQWASVNIPQDFQAGAQLLITREMAKAQPIEAASYILKADNTAYFRSNLGGLLSEWGRNNLDAADEWVRGNLDEIQRDMAFEHLALIVKFEQPQLAAQYAQELSSEVSRTDITTDILFDWRQKNKQGADDWISKNINSIDPVILQEVGYLED